MLQHEYMHACMMDPNRLLLMSRHYTLEVSGSMSEHSNTIAKTSRRSYYTNITYIAQMI